MLPAFTTARYRKGTTLIIPGSITSAVFVWWLAERLLLQLDSSYHIIIIDNASIHHLKEVKEVISATRFEVRYLPPYSLDLYPIELTFNTLKQWIRTHFEESKQFSDFADFIQHAADEAIGGDCSGYFKSCRYGVEGV